MNHHHLRFIIKNKGNLDWLLRGPLGDSEADLNEKAQRWREPPGGWNHRLWSKGVCHRWWRGSQRLWCKDRLNKGWLIVVSHFRSKLVLWSRSLRSKMNWSALPWGQWLPCWPSQKWGKAPSWPTSLPKSDPTQNLPPSLRASRRILLQPPTQIQWSSASLSPLPRWALPQEKRPTQAWSQPLLPPKATGLYS